jgi:Polyketide cyclase / dehydrase and lipid transport
VGPILRLVLGIAGLIAILAGVAVTLPSHVTVARSVVINGPETAIFPHVDNLRHVAVWLPWALRDPNLAITYSGPQAGKGAKMAWRSKDRAVGSGQIEIDGASPPDSVDLDVDYDGLQGTSTVQIQPSGSGSKVTWDFGYETGSNLLRRWKGLMLDRLVGTDYDRGLAKLKQVVEADLTSEDTSDTPQAPSTPPAKTPAPVQGNSVPKDVAP